MPFAGFKCLKCDARGLRGKEAMDHFARAHVAEGYCLPPAAIQMMEAGEMQERRQGPNVSPSMAGGCMREHALKRSVPYEVEPLSMWKPAQGTIFHKGLDMNCPVGWSCEVPMPAEGEVELWPGVPVSTRIDLLSEDGTRIEDYKTSAIWMKSKYDKVAKKYEDSYTLFPPGEDNTLQLNVEAAVVAKIRGGERPALGVWKFWNGCRDTAFSVRYYDIPLMDPGALEARVAEGPNGWREFRRVMQTPEGEERMAAIAGMPLAGRTMFGAKKCLEYCGVKADCDALIPEEERF